MPTHPQPLAGVLSLPTCSCKSENRLQWSDAVFIFAPYSGLGIATLNRANRLQKLFVQTKRGIWKPPPLPLKHHLETSCTAYWRGDSTCLKSRISFSVIAQQGSKKMCPPAQLYHSADNVTKGERAMRDIMRQQAKGGGRKINCHHTLFFFFCFRFQQPLQTLLVYPPSWQKNSLRI